MVREQNQERDALRRAKEPFQGSRTSMFNAAPAGREYYDQQMPYFPNAPAHAQGPHVFDLLQTSFESFVLIYEDRHGQAQCRSSNNLTPHLSERFHAGEVDHFWKGCTGQDEDLLNDVSQPLYPHKSNQVSKRSASVSVSSDEVDDIDDDDDDDLEPKWSAMKVIDTKKVSLKQAADFYRWYEDQFYHMQQFSCKTIAKEWIKVIHPKKQGKWPYNGGKKARELGLGQVDRGNATKPAWWPKHVQHKEPDHLDMRDRVELLLHILVKMWNRPCEGSRSQTVCVATLRAGTDKAEARIKAERNGGRAWLLLGELYQIREQQERFLREECSEHTSVQLNYYPRNRRTLRELKRPRSENARKARKTSHHKKAATQTQTQSRDDAAPSMREACSEQPRATGGTQRSLNDTSFDAANVAGRDGEPVKAEISAPASGRLDHAVTSGSHLYTPPPTVHADSPAKGQECMPYISPHSHNLMTPTQAIPVETYGMGNLASVADNAQSAQVYHTPPDQQNESFYSMRDSWHGEVMTSHANWDPRTESTVSFPGISDTIFQLSAQFPQPVMKNSNYHMGPPSDADLSTVVINFNHFNHLTANSADQNRDYRLGLHLSPTWDELRPR